MASSSGVQRRTKDKIFLVGYPCHQSTGCKLSSNRQVLCVLFYNLRTVKLTVRESAKLTIREVFIIWEKARIPTKHDQMQLLSWKNFTPSGELFKKIGRKHPKRSRTNLKSFLKSWMISLILLIKMPWL